jgi:transcriptional regulatory protein RtcR
VDFELERFARQQGAKVTFNREARAAYLRYAVSADAQWSGNFRDLSASITRMATLAPAGRISIDEVKEEIGRLRRHWRAPSEPAVALVEAVLGERAVEVDLFERAQLDVVLTVCRESKSLSDAGRRLFAVSRTRKASSNDADRLRKYLARFGLDWESASAGDVNRQTPRR